MTSKLSISLLVSSGTIFFSPALSSIKSTLLFISRCSVVVITTSIPSVVLSTSSKLSISLLVSSGTIFFSPALSLIRSTLLFISRSLVVVITTSIPSVVLLTSSKLSISLLVSSGTIFFSPALSSIRSTLLFWLLVLLGDFRTMISGTWFLESVSVLLTMTSMFWSLGVFRTSTSMSSSLGATSMSLFLPALSSISRRVVTSEVLVSILEALDSSWPGFLICSHAQLQWKKTKTNWVGVF